MLGLPTHRIRCAVCSYGSSGRCPREGRVDTTSARVKRVGASISAFAGASPPSLPRLGSFSSRRDGARVGLCSRLTTSRASAHSPRAAHSFFLLARRPPVRSGLPSHVVVAWLDPRRTYITYPKNGVPDENIHEFMTRTAFASVPWRSRPPFATFFLCSMWLDRPPHRPAASS